MRGYLDGKHMENTHIYIISGWWFGTCFIFPYIYILETTIPTDFHIFQRGRSTTNQFILYTFIGYVQDAF